VNQLDDDYRCTLHTQFYLCTSLDISSRRGVTATGDMTVLPGVLGCSFGFAQDRLPLR